MHAPFGFSYSQVGVHSKVSRITPNCLQGLNRGLSFLKEAPLSFKPGTRTKAALLDCIIISLKYMTTSKQTVIFWAEGDVSDLDLSGG